MSGLGLGFALHCADVQPQSSRRRGAVSRLPDNVGQALSWQHAPQSIVWMVYARLRRGIQYLQGSSRVVETPTHPSTAPALAPPCTSCRWADRVLAEFFAQGDAEARRGLPVSPLCDRHTTSRPGSQANFIEFVVAPLYAQVGGVWCRV